MNKPVKLRQLPAYSTNPFLEEMGSPDMSKKNEVFYTGDKVVINPKTGEVDDSVIGVAKVKYVESDKFVKLYTDQLGVFFELGKAAQRVCEFMMYKVGESAIGKGEVILGYPEYSQYFENRTGGTRSTFMRGVQELAGKQLIAKHINRDVWYINPAFLFNGNRARFITEYRRKRKPTEQQLEDAGQMRLLDDE